MTDFQNRQTLPRIASDVIQLAQERKRAYKAWMATTDSSMSSAIDLFENRDPNSSPEGKKYLESEEDLRDYLYSQDYDTIQSLEALMLFGREMIEYEKYVHARQLREKKKREYEEKYGFEYDSEDVYEEDPKPRPDFMSFINHIKSTYSDPDGMGLAISYITEKGPLPDYLSAGLRWL